MTAGDVFQSELLWDYIEEKAPNALQQRPVQPLTLLDLDDLELLMGLVEAGSSVVDLLRRKAESPFRKLEVQQWRAHDPTAPPEQRPSLLERRMRDVFAGIVDQLGFDPKRLDEERLGAAGQSWMREE